MTDKNKEIRVRKLQVKRGSQAEKELAGTVRGNTNDKP